ncbi:MAG: A/G-specific adenine glycosylase [Proteobacteria bacterium]|nr:A/G-specific adenine glycosylase [Pseudomonadota bacterium]
MSTALAASLLAWYDRHARVLPWRVGPKNRKTRPDPYRVWLSEIMLQQTTVVTVGPYFAEFLRRWPNVQALAKAPIDDVLAAWAGLGYYARARNLHKCARYVAEELGGVFPDTEEGLLTLPGVGPYTAAAIASIAFDVPAAVIDGNVERVITRVFKIETPLPAAKPEIRAAVAELVPDQRPGDFAQATMDLGATICTPRNPQCLLCPWKLACQACGGAPETYPRRTAKPKRPFKRAIAFVLFDAQGAVWVRKRADTGLLGGMLEVPSSEWKIGEIDETAARRASPAALAWRKAPGEVRHGFTHFELEFAVWIAQARRSELRGGLWVAADEIGSVALPTLMRKVIDHARKSISPAKDTKKGPSRGRASR